MPKTFKILPNLQNFGKSGHTGDDKEEGDEK